MATALIVTFITAAPCGSSQGGQSVSITSQTLTFVDIKPAERALEAIKEAHDHLCVDVIGTILKDVVI